MIPNWRTLLLAVTFASGSAFTQPVNANEFPPVEIPENYVASIDILYHQANDWEGRLDLYRPELSRQALPLLINIHGGGWNHGVKESQRGFGSFFTRQWVVANVEYRLSPQASAPAAVEDIRCAMVFLLNRSDEFRIDPDKVVLMGGSAGAHLAAMGALLGNDRRYDNGCEYDGNIQAAAVIYKYGVSNLVPVMHARSPRWWLGPNADNEDFARQMSPINWVSPDSPPFFITHGTADPIVPFEQSVSLAEQFEKAGVHHEFHIIENGQHGKFNKEEKQALNEALWIFLDSLGL